MLERIQTAPGQFVTRSFTVNVRIPKISSGGEVTLDTREAGIPTWDDKLTLQFSDTRPCVSAIQVRKVDDAITVYTIGDSTVTDQASEPFGTWAQQLPRWFKPKVAVANHAESGETLKSFITGLRLAKVLSQMKKGDYLFIQFGHNDSKSSWPQTYAEAGTTYQAYLKAFIAEARLRGATPVLVDPMQRRQFEANGKIRNSHGNYPEAVREVAKEEGVAFIDLTAMSVAFYEALGPDRAYLAFAGSGPNRDATHHDNYGAYELAKCIVQGIRDNKLDLARFIVDDFAGFDPAKPDPVESFSLPASPGRMTEAPRGN
jgi:lysophospholipase L1-like esterase